MYKNIY